jgi:hypothetical protein
MSEMRCKRLLAANVKKARTPRFQGLDPGEIAFRDFPFRTKAAYDKRYRTPLGSGDFCIQFRRRGLRDSNSGTRVLRVPVTQQEYAMDFRRMIKIVYAPQISDNVSRR